MALMDRTETPFVEWVEFWRMLSGRANGPVEPWYQGEHVTVIGPTGSGKTQLSVKLLGIRRAVAAFGTKSRDTTMDQLIRAGYWRTKRWNGDVDDYVVLWPKIEGAGHDKQQREIFEEAIDAIFRSGGWCVFLDEVSYMSDFLRMEKHLKFLLNQGRSAGISVVGCTQRPAFIPLAFYDQASHLFLFKDNDQRNIKRVGELAGLDHRQVAKEIVALRKHEFLYINKDTGNRVRSMVEV